MNKQTKTHTHMNKQPQNIQPTIFDFVRIITPERGIV